MNVQLYMYVMLCVTLLAVVLAVYVLLVLILYSIGTSSFGYNSLYLFFDFSYSGHLGPRISKHYFAN